MIKKRHGFTLLELLVSIALTGILVAIAYPTYSRFLLQSRRTDAFIALTQAQNRLEACYAHSFSYTQKCQSTPVFPHKSQQGYYLITLKQIKASGYTLKATPSGSQQQDHHCTSFTLNHLNIKNAMDANGTTQPDCWHTK